MTTGQQVSLHTLIAETQVWLTRSWGWAYFHRMTFCSWNMWFIWLMIEPFVRFNIGGRGDPVQTVVLLSYVTMVLVGTSVMGLFLALFITVRQHSARPTIPDEPRPAVRTAEEAVSDMDRSIIFDLRRLQEPTLFDVAWLFPLLNGMFAVIWPFFMRLFPHAVESSQRVAFLCITFAVAAGSSLLARWMQRTMRATARAVLRTIESIEVTGDRGVLRSKGTHWGNIVA